jgi:hypothetical protein
VARMGEGRNVYRVLVGKPEGKKPLGRPRRRWSDGIKTDLKGTGWGGGVGVCAMDSSGSGQGPVAGSREHGNEPSKFWRQEIVIFHFSLYLCKACCHSCQHVTESLK